MIGIVDRVVIATVNTHLGIGAGIIANGCADLEWEIEVPARFRQYLAVPVIEGLVKGQARVAIIGFSQNRGG